MTEGMYPLRPVFNLDARVELPTCMYSLPVIQVSKSLTSDGGPCPDSVLKALEARQEAILTKLGHLRDEVSKYRKSLGLATTFSSDTMPQEVKTDVVIRCSPSKPAFSLPGIVTMLSNHMTVFTSVHCHSCVPNLPGHLNNFLPTPAGERADANVKVTLIWKEVGNDCELMVSPISQSVIKGEVNIIRYFARLFPSVFTYENDRTATAVDNLLDSVTSLLWAQPKDRQPILRPLAVNLGKSSFLCGESFGIADLALFSALKQIGLERDLQPEFRRWFTLVSAKLMGVKGRRKSRASSSRKSFGNRRPSERRQSERRKSERRTSERRPSDRKNSEKAPNSKKEKSPKKEMTDKPAIVKEKSPKKDVKREASPKKALKTPAAKSSHSPRSCGKKAASQVRIEDNVLRLLEEQLGRKKEQLETDSAADGKKLKVPITESPKTPAPGSYVKVTPTPGSYAKKEKAHNEKNDKKSNQSKGKKSKTAKKSEVLTDRQSDNSPGSLFTRQWPEIRHLFQSSEFTSLLEQTALVSEKLDGSNLAVSSRNFISSRRNLLLNRPTSEELDKFKFSGQKMVNVHKLVPKLQTLESRFTDLFPFLTVECILYGELIQKGTATSKEDKYGYAAKGYSAGDLYAFGVGITFDDDLDAEQMLIAKKHLQNQGYVALLEVDQQASLQYLVLLMNPKLRQLLTDVGITNIVEQTPMSLEAAVEKYKEKLIKNQIEGIILVFNNSIYKWKGIEESYPDMFVEQISDLLQVLRFTNPDKLNPIQCFLEVSQAARQASSKKRPENKSRAHLENAFNSAISKWPRLEEELEQSKEPRISVINRYILNIKKEMIRDANKDKKFAAELDSFIKSKLQKYL